MGRWKSLLLCVTLKKILYLCGKTWFAKPLFSIVLSKACTNTPSAHYHACFTENNKKSNLAGLASAV